LLLSLLSPNCDGSCDNVIITITKIPDREIKAIDIIPAIDLRNGKCVRLYQGDYARETVYDDDPLQVALRWQEMGAQRIHMVDLDGAAAGDVVNFEVIENIANAILVPTQLGGGIRTLETITRVLQAGVERVILGTIAVENPDLVQAACDKYAGSIIVSIDARDGQVATRGWVQGTSMSAIQLAKDMVGLGVKRFIYTDIARDGTLSGPNYAGISELIEAIRLPVIAAGGVASLEHLRVLKRLGVEGAIIGKALYTGDIDLQQAVAISNE
jgi:phosphoribosylformimino-5-aminoimidazole carboxamide ribotide isomerase